MIEGLVTETGTIRDKDGEAVFLKLFTFVNIAI